MSRAPLPFSVWRYPVTALALMECAILNVDGGEGGGELQDKHAVNQHISVYGLDWQVVYLSCVSNMERRERERAIEKTRPMQISALCRDLEHLTAYRCFE